MFKWENETPASLVITSNKAHVSKPDTFSAQTPFSETYFYSEGGNCKVGVTPVAIFATLIGIYIEVHAKHSLAPAAQISGFSAVLYHMGVNRITELSRISDWELWKCCICFSGVKTNDWSINQKEIVRLMIKTFLVVALLTGRLLKWKSVLKCINFLMVQDHNYSD